MTTTIIVTVEHGDVQDITNIPNGFEVKVVNLDKKIDTHFKNKSLGLKPTMTPVVSSNIASVGYNEDEKLLFIQFNNGSVYSYVDVPADLVEKLHAAESVGSFFNANIKTKFVYNKE